MSSRLNASQRHLEELQGSMAGQSHDVMMSAMIRDVIEAVGVTPCLLLLSGESGHPRSAERRAEELQTENSGQTCSWSSAEPQVSDLSIS